MVVNTGRFGLLGCLPLSEPEEPQCTQDDSEGCDDADDDSRDRSATQATTAADRRGAWCCVWLETAGVDVVDVRAIHDGVNCLNRCSGVDVSDGKEDGQNGYRDLREVGVEDFLRLVAVLGGEPRQTGRCQYRV